MAFNGKPYQIWIRPTTRWTTGEGSGGLEPKEVERKDMETRQQQDVQKRYQQELSRYQKQIQQTKKLLGKKKAA